jgi:hypothetical protein
MVNRLETGETITGGSATATLDSGYDPAMSLTVVGPADISAAPKVRVRVRGGLVGCTYQVAVECTTSLGNVKTGAVLLPVKKGGA